MHYSRLIPIGQVSLGFAKNSLQSVVKPSIGAKLENRLSRQENYSLDRHSALIRHIIPPMPSCANRKPTTNSKSEGVSGIGRGKTPGKKNATPRAIETPRDSQPRNRQLIDCPSLRVVPSDRSLLKFRFQRFRVCQQALPHDQVVAALAVDDVH